MHTSELAIGAEYTYYDAKSERYTSAKITRFARTGRPYGCKSMKGGAYTKEVALPADAEYTLFRPAPVDAAPVDAAPVDPSDTEAALAAIQAQARVFSGRVYECADGSHWSDVGANHVLSALQPLNWTHERIKKTRAMLAVADQLRDDYSDTTSVRMPAPLPTPKDDAATVLDALRVEATQTHTTIVDCHGAHWAVMPPGALQPLLTRLPRAAIDAAIGALLASGDLRETVRGGFAVRMPAPETTAPCRSVPLAARYLSSVAVHSAPVVSAPALTTGRMPPRWRRSKHTSGRS